MAIPQCRDDRDCPEAEVCYANVSWRLGVHDNGCDCSTFYGFVRNSTGQCSLLDVTGYYWVGNSIVLLTILVVLFFVSVWDIGRLLARNKFSGALATTSIFIALALLSCMADVSGFLISEYFPIYSPMLYVDASNPASDKEGRGANVERIGMTLFTLATILAGLNVPLFWLEVVERSKSMNAARIRNISKYRWPLIIFLIIFTAIYIILGLILGLQDILAVVALPVLIGALVLYIVSLRKMQYLFGSTQAETNDSRFITQFSRSARITIVGLLVTFYALLAYGLMNITIGWREACPPGVVPYHIFNIILARYSLVIISFGAMTFTHVRIADLTSVAGRPETSSDKSKAQIAVLVQPE